MKICKKCGEDKLAADYYWEKRGETGQRSNICIACTIKKRKEKYPPKESVCIICRNAFIAPAVQDGKYRKTCGDLCYRALKGKILNQKKEEHTTQRAVKIAAPRKTYDEYDDFGSSMNPF